MSTIKKLFTTVTVLFMVLSCGKKVVPKKQDKSKPTAALTIDEKTKRERTAFLLVKGEDPFWSVEISQQSIKFISINASESFEVPYVAPMVSQNGQGRIYKSKNENFEIEVAVTTVKCKNIVLEPDYATTVRFRKIGDVEFQKKDACAKPIADVRLNYVWRLFEVNGIRVTPEDFGKELPYIDLHIKEYAFTGFAGCNRIKGELIMEEGAGLIFNSIKATKMTCLSGNKENLVMAALRNSNRYEINNGKLYIFKGKVLQAVFTKAT